MKRSGDIASTLNEVYDLFKHLPDKDFQNVLVYKPDIFNLLDWKHHKNTALHCPEFRSLYLAGDFLLKFKVSKIQKVFQHAHGWHIRPRRNGIWSKWLIISCPSVNCYLAVCHTERDHDPSLSDDWEFGPRLLIISTHCSYPSCPTLQLPIFKNHSWLPQLQIL